MANPVHFRALDKDEDILCAACEIESHRIPISATHRMRYVDSGMTEKDYPYCPKHVNRISVDMRISGMEVFIDDEPIRLPLEYDVDTFVKERKAKWEIAHDMAKRERIASDGERPQNKPKKTTKKRNNNGPKPDANFQWI